ncbi:MAG: 2-succinyl-6-hydroxy-2,4-cyclohexadiene-1-carboxylate synthase [Candidatus Woesearchaeota archaeon]|nr:2-succinyl-6-hydroxy-2,4-cyclohexadiene-1-carboxylate synthase [Candidatus Woesearchaeota archaeon]
MKFSNELHDMDSLVEHVHSFVEKKKLDNFDLAGFSLGGIVAVKYTHLYGEKVKNLFVLNSSPRLVRKNMQRFIKIFNPIITSALFCNLFRYFNTNNLIRKIFGIHKLSNQNATKKFPRAIYGTMFNVLSISLVDEFNSLKIPKTIALFKDDTVLRFKNQKDLVPSLNSNVIVFDKGGHMTRPEYLENIITIFN